MKNITEEIKNYIRENYYYSPLTGELWFRSKNYSKICGCLHHSGYRQVRILGESYRVHRVCWFLYYGEFSEKFTDHIDRNRSNNKIDNLREVTMQQNNFNASKRVDNTSHFKGVHWLKSINKWRARIQYNKKRILIGDYLTAKEASVAYQKKATELFGEFNPQRVND